MTPVVFAETPCDGGLLKNCQVIHNHTVTIQTTRTHSPPRRRRISQLQSAGHFGSRTTANTCNNSACGLGRSRRRLLRVVVVRPGRIRVHSRHTPNSSPRSVALVWVYFRTLSQRRPGWRHDGRLAHSQAGELLSATGEINKRNTAAACRPVSERAAAASNYYDEND